MLRTFRPNARKNWPVLPSQWNQFFLHLEKDMVDLNSAFHAQTFSLTPIITASDTVTTTVGDDSKTNYPNI